MDGMRLFLLSYRSGVCLLLFRDETSRINAHFFSLTFFLCTLPVPREIPVRSPHCLIIFTRYPEPGQAKTRLIPALGPTGAAEQHRQMVEHCLREARQLRSLRLQMGQPLDLEIHYTGGTLAAMQAWLGPDLTYCLQGTGSLGDRLSDACETAVTAGVQSLLIMGTDCPGINAPGLATALHHLQHHDLVVGPALDGGYYLLGLRSWIPELFQDIPWSTDTVFADTCAIAERLQLRTQILPTLSDVDHPEDLIHWHQATAKISVVIPALNEAHVIASTLTRLKTAQYTEIILVDGGSHDQTVTVAQAAIPELPLQVLTRAPGRAHQLNQGAAAATGKILLFLHADTQLPDRFDLLLRAALAQQPLLAGAFTLKIDAPQRGLRLIERLVNWRSRFLHMPYGDQALFMATAVFQAVGGFPLQPIMEDYELLRRLNRRQYSILMLSAAVLTSGRRWQRLGLVKTTVLNQLIILAYHLGVSPTRLARWYRQQKP